MAWLVRTLFLTLLPLVSACSIEATIERMTTPQDRAFAQHFVEDLRDGDAEGLKAAFAPELWAASAGQLRRAASSFPRRRGTTRLVGYHALTNVSPGVSRTDKEYILVTTDEVRWTRTVIRTHAEGRGAKVVGWNVQPFDRKPPDLEWLENMERIAPWIVGGVVVVLIGFAILIWWLVRRSRRRASVRA